MVLTDAIKVLTSFAQRHIDVADEDEQVKVYLALAETLENQAARHQARELAKAKSHVAALQITFREIINS